MGQGLAGKPQTYSRLKDIMAGLILSPDPEPALSKMEILGVFEVFIDGDYGAHHTFDDQYKLLHIKYIPRLAWSGLTAKPKKSGFFLEKISPLEFEASTDRLWPSSGKMKANAEYPEQTLLDEVCTFLAITTYLRHFIPRHADLAVIMKEVATLEPREE
jgi:hypothetical protein